jgi:hypothetical protein
LYISQSIAYSGPWAFPKAKPPVIQIWTIAFVRGYQVEICIWGAAAVQFAGECPENQGKAKGAASSSRSDATPFVYLILVYPDLVLELIRRFTPE